MMMRLPLVLIKSRSMYWFSLHHLTPYRQLFFSHAHMDSWLFVFEHHTFMTRRVWAPVKQKKYECLVTHFIAVMDSSPISNSWDILSTHCVCFFFPFFLSLLIAHMSYRFSLHISVGCWHSSKVAFLSQHSRELRVDPFFLVEGTCKVTHTASSWKLNLQFIHVEKLSGCINLHGWQF